MTTFKLKRLSGVGSKTKGGDRLKGDPRLLGLLSFPDGNYVVATPQGYDSVKLSFLVPSAFVNYTRMAVVRSTYGFPVNKHDGVTVFEYPNTATPLSQTFVDTNFGQGLIQGQWYYYTLFAKMPNSIPNWNQVDTDFCVVTKDYGSSDNLWNKIPAFYRQEDANTLQRQLLYTDGGQLRRFVDLIGFEIDMIRTVLDTLLDVNHPPEMLSTLLDLQGYDLSLLQEDAIGDARFRSLVTNAISIRESKGTAAGLAEYVRSISDWDVRLLARRNMFQSSVQSRFQDASNALFPSPFGDGVNPTFDPTVVGGASSLSGSSYRSFASDGIPEPTATGYTKVDWAYKIALAFISSGTLVTSNIINLTVDANGAVVLTGLNPENTRFQAIVVPTTGVTYTYSFVATLAQANTTACGAIQVRFVWYDGNGAWISSDTHAVSGTPAFSLAQPALLSATSSAAPVNAKFCDAQIVFAAFTNSFQMWVSGQQFELSSGFNSIYIDPHTVEIQLIAQRVNLIQNPSAEVDNTLWTTLNMTSFTSTVVATATAGGKVFRITCNASTPTRMTVSSFMPINPAYVYSMRFNAMVPNATIGCNAIIIWYDGAATPNVIRTDTLNFPAPLPTSVMREFIFGSVIPPAGAVQARAAIEFTAVANGNVIDVDSILFGPGPPMWYFDGDTQDGLDTPLNVTPSQFSDFQWGGTQGKSTSYYYNNFYIIQKRLTLDLPNWLPFGTPSTLLTKIAP